MSRFNAVPVAIQQIAESMLDPNTNANVQFNQSQVLENVRDYCDQALAKYKKKRIK